jgi:hypothetical protein
MKTIFLVLLVFLISCSTNEVEIHYPDCIDQPSELKDSRGCGNVFVYQFLDSTTALVLSIDKSKVNLTKECQTINLENQQDQITVRLEEAGTSLDSIYFNYCNDVAYINQGELKIYNGTKGIITFSVSEDNPIKDPIWESNYNITIEIIDLHLYDQTGNLKLIIDKIVYWNVGVGWMPG